MSDFLEELDTCPPLIELKHRLGSDCSQPGNLDSILGRTESIPMSEAGSSFSTPGLARNVSLLSRRDSEHDQDRVLRAMSSLAGLSDAATAMLQQLPRWRRQPSGARAGGVSPSGHSSLTSKRRGMHGNNMFARERRIHHHGTQVERSSASVITASPLDADCHSLIQRQRSAETPLSELQKEQQQQQQHMLLTQQNRSQQQQQQLQDVVVVAAAATSSPSGPSSLQPVSSDYPLPPSSSTMKEECSSETTGSLETPNTITRDNASKNPADDIPGVSLSSQTDLEGRAVSKKLLPPISGWSGSRHTLSPTVLGQQAPLSSTLSSSPSHDHDCRTPLPASLPPSRFSDHHCKTTISAAPSDVNHASQKDGETPSRSSEVWCHSRESNVCHDQNCSIERSKDIQDSEYDMSTKTAHSNHNQNQHHIKGPRSARVIRGTSNLFAQRLSNGGSKIHPSREPSQSSLCSLGDEEVARHRSLTSHNHLSGAQCSQKTQEEGQDVKEKAVDHPIQMKRSNHQWIWPLQFCICFGSGATHTKNL